MNGDQDSMHWNHPLLVLAQLKNCANLVQTVVPTGSGYFPMVSPEALEKAVI